MPAKIIDGKALANEVYHELAGRVKRLGSRGIIPCIAIICIGDDELDKRRVALKENAAMKLGMESVTYCLRQDVTQERVVELIKKLNADENIHGIIVQTPMPDQLDVKAVLESIDPEKDLDGLHFCNAGKLLNGDPAIVACTPRAIGSLTASEWIFRPSTRSLSGNPYWSEGPLRYVFSTATPPFPSAIPRPRTFRR